MGSPMMVQVDLWKIPEARGHETPNKELTTWVEDRDDLAEGKILTLKGYPGKEWQIVKLYDTKVPKDHLGVRGFKNNI